MPYQNLPRFEPNYGNRYGFRQRVNAPATGPAGVPPTGAPTSPSQPQTTGGSSRPGDSYHSGPNAETIDGGDDSGSNASDVRSDAARAQGHVVGQQTPGQIAANLIGFASPIPGVASLLEYTGLPGSLDDKLGTNIPAHERYGAAGTIDPSSGGVFGASGRAYDPVTGQALNSYNSKNSFKNSAYVQGIFDNPFSVDSYLGDPENAQAYTAANNARAAGSNAALGFNAAQLGERGIYGGQDDTGGGISPEEADRLAQYVGQTEYGFEEHTVAPDTATNDAIQGIGYTGSGAAPQGSQFSSSGTFSSSHSDNNNDSNNNDDYNDQGVSHSGGSTGVSFADDAASSNDGGGGGK